MAEKFQFRQENQEQGATSLVLDEDKLRGAGWGRNIEVLVGELVKVFAVVKNISEKGLKTKQEIKKEAQDLFNEFGIKFYDFEDIFSNNVIDQIEKSKGIKEISIKEMLNDTPVKIMSGSTTESVMKEWEDNQPKESEEEKEERLQEEKEDQEKRQKKLNGVLEKLEKLDFKNINSVIEWIIKFRYPSSFNDLDFKIEDVIKKFTDNGYELDNDYETTYKVDKELGLHSKEEVGRHMVGGFLAQFKHSGFVTPNWDDIMNEWKNS